MPYCSDINLVKSKLVVVLTEIANHNYTIIELSCENSEIFKDHLLS